MPLIPPKLQEFETVDAAGSEYTDLEGLMDQTGLPEAKIIQYFSKSGPGGYAIDPAHGSFKKLYSTKQVEGLLTHLEKILKVEDRKLLLQKMINRLKDAANTSVL